MIRSRIVVLLAALGAACSPPPEFSQVEDWRDVAVTSRAASIDPARPGARRVGELVFRGGVALSSKDRAFGGWSGLWVGADGAFIAVNDAGRILKARLVSDESGAPERLTDVRIGFLRDEEGGRLMRRGTRDAEGIARLPDGRFAVSFESITRVMVYDLDQGEAGEARIEDAVFSGLERATANTTLEGVAAAGEGRVLVGAERIRRGAPLWFAPIENGAPVTPSATLDLPFGYGLSDLTRLPDGDYVALLRFYAPVLDARLRIVRISADLSRTTTLADLAPPLRLDNFEGASAVALPGGGARLTLISDDNYAPTQRTLLYVFDLNAKPGS